MDIMEAIKEGFEFAKSIVRQIKLRKVKEDLEMQTDGQFYLRKSERGKGLIPYCPACFETAGKLVPLVEDEAQGMFRCAIHQLPHYTKEYHDHKRRRTATFFGVSAPQRRSIWNMDF